LKKKKIIGFDRKIELEWIDYTAELVSKGLPESEIRENLAQKLSVYGLGSSKGGALSKTITVLTRLWLNVSEDIIPLRDKALDLYKSASNDEKVVLHICLAITNYPFFFDVMTQIGRLLKLQDSFSSNQVTRRIVEKWGDTQRVKRSVDHVLQALKLWGVIEPLQKISLYHDSKNSYIPRKKIRSFIEDSLRITLENKFTLRESNSHPAMFFVANWN
jgi:hypothetical protein